MLRVQPLVNNKWTALPWTLCYESADYHSMPGKIKYSCRLQQRLIKRKESLPYVKVQITSSSSVSRIIGFDFVIRFQCCFVTPCH